MASYLMDRPWNPASQLERMLRRVVTLGLGREVRKVRATGTRVHVLTPGPEDLAAMGPNLMNPRSRLLVLETSLRTSAAALAGYAEPTDLAACVPPGRRGVARLRGGRAGAGSGGRARSGRSSMPARLPP